MKVVNDSLKNSLKKPTTQRKGRILVGENYYEVYNVKYYADAYNEGNVIGNAIASQLDFEMPYIEKFNTFKYFDGVWNGSSYEYVDFGTFTVFDEKDEDDFNKHITAFDNLIKFNIPFNDVGGYPKTLFQELQNVCSQAGVQLLNITIPNGDFIVDNNQFVNGESLKTVLKQICSISGNYAIIKDDMLVLQLKNNTNEIIDKSQHEPVDWKRRTYGINQVIIGVSNVEGEYVIRQDEQDIEQNGVHKLVINDNLFAYTQSKRDELIDELFQQVRGFGYLPYEMSCEWLNYLEIGDTITIDNIETIVLRIEGSSPKSLESKISAPAIIDSSIEYLDNTNDVKNQLKRTEIIVDKNNQSIQSVIEQTDEQNQKIAQVTQTVEELNSKISDIADITTSAEDTDAKIEINEVNQSEPIRLVVRPIGESISNLLISSNMLISDNFKLKQRVIRFTNIDTNDFFDYALPEDLWYHDSENYDEFILDYDGQSCVVNKKVGINEDGTTYILENPTTLNFPYPTGDDAINLTDGDYIVEILGYDTGYIFARLMAKNIYTTQFYTKAETNSIISQNSQNIDLSVNQKLSNYSTTSEMNSAIQLSASGITSTVSQTYETKQNAQSQYSQIRQTTDSISSTVSTKVGNNEVISKINQSAEQITINANKLDIDSIATFTNSKLAESGSTTINGDNVKTGNIASNNYVSGTSGTKINLSDGSIDSKNFKVSADGTVTATNGVFNGTMTAGNGSKIGGLTMTGGILKSNRLSLDAVNGILNVYNYEGGSMILSNAVRLSATAGIGITSNSTGTISAPTQNIDIKACSGATVYIGSMGNSTGTTEKSAVSVENGVLAFRSTGYCSYNGTTVFNSSSKATKENIIDLTQAQKDEVYELIKNIPLKEYDYKQEYSGNKNNYGFIIEDIEETKLKDLLHINQNEFNEDIKMYSHEDLTRLELVVIQELIKKIESLEEQINVN